MPPPRRPPWEAAEALAAVAPLASRWIERLLAGHDPPVTIAQFLALRAIGGEGVSASELARRTGVSGPAVSQLLTGLADSGLLQRREFADDRRRQTLALSPTGQRVVASANALLRDRFSELLSELPRPDADHLARALPHLEAVLAGSPPPRRPPRPPPPPPHGHPPRPRHER